MIQKRDIAISIVLTIVTCGIYGIFWFISLNDDAKNASGDETLPSGGVAFLLTLVTCGIYGIYWAYKMGKTLQAAQSRAGMAVSSDNSILYLILQLFGFGIINYALMQNQLNTIAGAGPDQQSAGNNSSNGGTNGGASQQPATPAASQAATAQEATVVSNEAPANSDKPEDVVVESVEETVVEEE